MDVFVGVNIKKMNEAEPQSLHFMFFIHSVPSLTLSLLQFLDHLMKQP
jgi:hypothetical protein